MNSKTRLFVSAIALSLSLTQAQAALSRDQEHRLPSFSFQGGKAVFTDFITAVYNITYDGSRTETLVKSEIDFELAEAGFPVFDLVAEPASVKVDGIEVRADLVKTPDNATDLRVMDHSFNEGRHHLTIESPLTRQVPALNGFFMDDSVERFFLERYIPASFEYDHVKMKFNVSFENFGEPWKIYSNGTLAETGNQKFTVDFPDYLTCSSLYFHAVPVNFAVLDRFVFNSIDGRKLTVQAYHEVSESAYAVPQTQIKSYLQKLEAALGPFPHQSVTIYFGRSHVDHYNDMEYSGATIATPGSLYHELSHSYFARGVMPANANANWIDEALATWTQTDFASYTTAPGHAQLATLPTYARYCWNISSAYGMSHLFGYLSSRYRILPFIKYWGKLRFGQSVTTEELIQDLEGYLQASVRTDFEKAVY